MLPLGTEVLAFYRGRLEDGTVVDALGSAEQPQVVVIGGYGLSRNVSTALATMEPGETRIVKAPVFRKGRKPVLAEYEVGFAKVLSLDAIQEERLHGAECACGCHKLRAALLRS